MNTHNSDAALGHRLLQLGTLLFLLGLFVGFAVPALANPRMGLASHLEGVMNGMFLLVLGLIWNKLRLSRKAGKTLYWLALYGTFANWTATLLAAFWGAGSMMEIAAAGQKGTVIQETIIGVLLVSLSVAMVGVCFLMLWGLRVGPVRDEVSTTSHSSYPGRGRR